MLLLLLSAVLFLRPAEMILALSGLPIYALLIVMCMLLAFPVVLDQLSPQSLSAHPITACVVGLLFAVVFSQLARSAVWNARMDGLEFVKIVNFYLLVVGLVTTTGRLRRFLAWLVGVLAIVSALALLQLHGLLSLDTLDTIQQSVVDPKTGETYIVQRLRGVGIFQDPNDLGMILVTAMISCLYLMGNARSLISRLRWIGLLGLLGVTLAETHSRGGFLALLVASIVLFYCRYGTRKTIPLAAAALPLLFFLFAGRQTNLSLSDDTGQARIQLWSQGLTELRGSPWFGIGSGRYGEEIGQVAHNSFVHAFVELGIFGGTLFLGAFAIALREVHRVTPSRETLLESNLQLLRLRPYMLAMIAGYAAGMMSLSRTDIVPTYLILALATVYLNLVKRDQGTQWLRFDARLIQRLIVNSLVFLSFIYVFVRLFARWG